jgi:hypothetical protein
MALKTIMSIAFLTGFKILYESFNSAGIPPETAIDKTWWNGLTAEWRNVLLINQNINAHHADIFAIQEEYINRLNATQAPARSEMNQPVSALNDSRLFSQSYNDLYARAVRTGHIPGNDSINLETLVNLDTLYLVNGPSDLSPLRKFKHLKVLILNFCGTDDGASSRRSLDLEPLRHLTALRIVQCAFNRIKSLDPLRKLYALEELRLDNSNITDLSALKNLVNLKKLSFGSNVERAPEVSRLIKLEELYIKGCKRIPNLSRLKKLRILSIAESEMSLVRDAYRTHDIGFLKSLHALEFLDLSSTSYRGDISVLYTLQHLRAVTLPSVKPSDVALFKTTRRDCVVINAYQFER